MFPWGSLLAAVAGASEAALANIRRVCKTNARLTVVIGLDAVKDRTEIERLELPEAVEATPALGSYYTRAGFRLIEVEKMPTGDAAKFRTSWAKRLAQNPNRQIIRLTAVAD